MSGGHSITLVWKRLGTTLYPVTLGDNVTTTGEIGCNTIFINDYWMPAADGSANQIIETNGSGTLSWTAKPTRLWEIDGTETQLITADEIDMQTNKIINITDPTANQDAATKKYVDDGVLWEETPSFIQHTSAYPLNLKTGAVAADHGAAATDQVINVCYGTGDPPAANTTTEGTVFFRYTA